MEGILRGMYAILILGYWGNYLAMFWGGVHSGDTASGLAFLGLAIMLLCFIGGEEG